MSAQARRCLVVGGGIVGLSVAYHLATMVPGVQVTLVERGRLGEGTTASATGGIRQQFATEVNARLVQRSIEKFHCFEDDTGFALNFRQNGYLFLIPVKSAERHKALIKLQNSWGIPSRWLEDEEINRLVSGINLADIAGATYCPTDGSLVPHDIVAGYHQACRRAGVNIYQNCTLQSLLLSGNGSVHGGVTDKGRIDADQVILASGVWTPSILKQVEYEIPITAHRRQAFGIQGQTWPPPGSPFVVDLETGAYIHTEDHEIHVVGGNDRDVPADTGLEIDWQLAERLIAALTHRFPKIEDAKIRSSWAGYREMTPDDTGMAGPIGVSGDLWVAAGFSGHGIMQAPAVGESLAAEILGVTEVPGVGAPIDITDLSPERFHDQRKMKEEDLVF